MNIQPVHSAARTSGHTLSVHSIFPTIQGEGPFAGWPAVFVRLGFCNLRCPLCDTKYTDGVEQLPLAEIIREVAGHQLPLVVITGGEPFRQNLYPLARRLVLSGMQAQIETNGKLPIQDFDRLRLLHGLSIVVSPKTGSIWPTLGHLATAYKYVICADDVAEDGLPTMALGHPLGRFPSVARPPKDYAGMIYVQPADEQDSALNARNMASAVASVRMDPLRRRLCLQLHKYAGLE